MNILIIISGMDPLGGGPPNLVVSLANALSKLSNQVTIASLRNEQSFDSYWQNKLEKSVQFLEFPTSSWRRIGYSSSLEKFVLQNVHQYDLVHCHSVWEISIQRCLRIFRLKSKKSFISTHGFFDIYSMKQSWFRKTIALVLFGINKNVRYSKLICGSESEIKNTQSNFKFKLNTEILENCFDNYIEYNMSSDEEFGNNFFDSYIHGKKVFLVACRFHDKKSILETVAAFKKIDQRSTPASLLILGLPDDPSYEDEVYRMVGNCSNIYLTSEIFGEAQNRFFKVSNFFIQVSKQEGFSLSTLMALEAGLTCLISPESNMITLQDQNFIEFSDPNVISIERGISELANISASDLENRKKQAMIYFDKNFSQKVIAKKLLEIYEK